MIAIVLTTWHLAFATLMTQILARTTTLLDGRKTVKMTGKIYLRAIVPIGACFSLSLMFGNLTYLYLSVAFIQMLKVCGHSLSIVLWWNLTPSLGHHTCCSPPCRMGFRRKQTQRQSLLQRLLYCYRCHHRFHWRDQIRPPRVPLSTWRNCLRSDPLGDGRAAPKFCRVQDGPPSLLILLCPRLCHHELLRFCFL